MRYTHTYHISIPAWNICQQLVHAICLCLLPLWLHLFNDRPRVDASFLTMSIHCSGGHPLGLLTTETSRASVRACAAGEFDAALMQWPNLPCCTILAPDQVYRPSFEMRLGNQIPSSFLRHFQCHLSKPSIKIFLVVQSSLL